MRVPPAVSVPHTVPAHRSRRHGSIPTLLHGWIRRALASRPPRPRSGATAAADAAAEDGEQQEAADGGGDADDEGLVVVDPGLDFFGRVGAFAVALEGSGEKG